MASAVTDLLSRVTDSTTGRPVISSLSAPKTLGAVSISLSDATNWTTTTAIHFSIYNTTSAGIKDPTSQTDWKGTLSGTTISNLTITGGTDQAYSAGAKVELTPTARWAKDLYDNVSAHANQDGSLKTAAVQSALNIAATSTDWTPLANTPTMVSSAGQREQVIQYTGVNYTDRFQAGTKLQIPRTGTTPTQSMSFVAASSQYAAKASPTGLTQTDDITFETEIYADSYNANIASGRSATSNGWRVFINASGQLYIYGYNGASYRGFYSYQSLPLNKWSHIAFTLDMSGYTTATCKIFIDGVDVPIGFDSAGTPTSFVAGTTFTLGNCPATPGFLGGKLANARLWSTIRTAAQIRDNMNQENPASTTGLIGHWKGNGSWNDSSTNANHLTAVSGAVNNYASHPYSATEYAIVTGLTYTGGNTQVTVFTGSNCLPNETLGTSAYSSVRAPYGFPADSGKWAITMPININQDKSTGLARWILQNPNGVNMMMPTGSWKVKGQLNGLMTTSVSQPFNQVAMMLSKTTTVDITNGNPFSRLFAVWTLSVSSSEADSPTFYVEDTLTNAAQTPLYILVGTASANISLIRIVANTSVTLECAYL